MISVFQFYRTGNDIPIQNSSLYQHPCILLIFEFQGYGKIMVTFQAIRRFARISPEHEDVINQISGIKNLPGCLVNQRYERISSLFPRFISVKSAFNAPSASCTASVAYSKRSQRAIRPLKSYTPLSSSILMTNSSSMGKGEPMELTVKCTRYVNSCMLKATRSYTLPISSRFSSDMEAKPTYSDPGAEEIRPFFNRSDTCISCLVVMPSRKSEKS